MHQILTGLLLFISLYILLDIFLKYHTIGLFTEEIRTSIFGNDQEYIDPMSKSIFLEFIHMEIFFSMMILLTLNAIFIRLNHTRPYTAMIANATMLSALLSLVSIAVAYFFLSELISFYVVTFFLWHASALYMALISLKRLYFV